MVDLLHVLKRRWRIVAGAVLLGAILGAIVTVAATPSYRARTQLFVALDSADTATELNSAASFSSQRVTSYPDLIDSPLVLEPVIEELGLDLTVADLAESVSAEVPPNTVLILVSADDPSARLAADIADAVAARLAAVVGDLDKTREDSTSPVRVSITTPATVPPHARTPVPALNIGLGVAIGVVLGVAAAVLREALDTSVRDDVDVTETTGLPVLGQVPTRAGDGRALRADPEHVSWSESYRTLRTNLSYLDPDHPVRLVMVTSALPGEGKSTTAVNLAASLAQGGHRTLLIDADLRRPAIGDMLDLSRDVGLTSVVTGRLNVADALQHHHGHDVLVSGPVPPNPSELLGTQAFRSLVAQLTGDYDRIVVDTPPLLAVTDAAVVSRVADGCVLVVEARRTRRADLRRAVAALDAVEARVVGVVLNRVFTGSSSDYRYDAVSTEAPAGTSDRDGRGRERTPPDRPRTRT